MKKLDPQTPDFTDQNIAKLAELFPNCVTESRDEDGALQKAIDFDLLKQELSKNIVEGTKERYRLEWPGKKEALLAANTPIDKTLRPAREESVDFDTTKNLYIEGDNLEALKLLQEAYLGKVKMIYIDPPYNTGKDFVYKDNFTRGRYEELEESGQVDSEGNRLVQNLESNGRFHSDWLSMMYPRLRLARNLLKDDGVIFISIDDNEVHNLRKICDEVFGEGNFVANIVWQKKYGPANDAKYISQTHEYVLVYAKSIISWSPGLLPRSESQLSAFSNPDNDPRGVWRASDLSVRTYNDNCDYDIIGPDGSVYKPPASRAWAVNEKRFKELLADNRITFGKNGKSRPMLKKFLTEVKQGITPDTWWDREKSGDNKIARYEMKEIFPENIFDTPKPTKLILLATRIANLNHNDIILDFFSGSATTAHAVMQLNAEDGGNRRFIMVQLPEKTDEKSEAYKAGYKTIAEIGKERIRRAGRKIKEENKDKEGIEHLDIGFRVLKIDSSNFKDIYATPDNITQESLFETVEHIKADRSAEDLLFGVLVRWGVDLSLPIRRETVEGKEVFFVGHGDLAACFEEEIDEALVKSLAKKEVLRVVFKESSFKDDNIKINTEQIFKQLAPATEVRVI